MGTILEDDDRVTGRDIVTGKAKYAAEHDVANITYGVLVGSNIAKGSIAALDTAAISPFPFRQTNWSSRSGLCAHVPSTARPASPPGHFRAAHEKMETARCRSPRPF